MVTVQLIESASDSELLTYVERGDLDLSFVMPPLPEGPFATLELMRDPWVILVPADSPLADRREPDLAERGGRAAADRRAALPQPRAGCMRTSALAASSPATCSTRTRTTRSTDSSPPVPGSRSSRSSPSTPTTSASPPIELGPKVPPRVIALAWHRDRYRSPAAEAFVELASRLCAELAPDLGRALSAA